MLEMQEVISAKLSDAGAGAPLVAAWQRSIIIDSFVLFLIHITPGLTQGSPRSSVFSVIKEMLVCFLQVVWKQLSSTEKSTKLKRFLRAAFGTLLPSGLQSAPSISHHNVHSDQLFNKYL